MAYNFLELVNEINRRVNEVELTTSTFPTTTCHTVTFQPTTS